MEIIRVPSRHQAPDEVDCISVVLRQDGKYELQGTALAACGDGDDVESVSVIGMPPFDTREQAEDVGLAWAADQCVERIYVTDVEFSIRRE